MKLPWKMQLMFVGLRIAMINWRFVVNRALKGVYVVLAVVMGISAFLHLLTMIPLDTSRWAGIDVSAWRDVFPWYLFGSFASEAALTALMYFVVMHFSDGLLAVFAKDTPGG